MDINQQAQADYRAEYDARLLRRAAVIDRAISILIAFTGAFIVVYLL